MKTTFTDDDMDAIVEVYYDHEGFAPWDLKHSPSETTYQVLQALWYRMKRKYDKKVRED